MRKTKQTYVQPAFEVVELKYEGVLCGSNGGMGTEGEDAPVFELDEN